MKCKLFRVVYYNRGNESCAWLVTMNFRGLWKIIIKDIRKYINDNDYDGYMRIVINDNYYILTAYSVYGKINVFVEGRNRTRIGVLEL